MPIRFANNLESSIADVGGLPIGDMSFSLAAGDGSKLLTRVPDINTSGVYIYATLVAASGDLETIKITGLSGDVCTIGQRAVEQEDVELNWAQNDLVRFVTSAKTLDDLRDSDTATIAQNTADIAQNVSDISQNASDIAQNAADIAQNSSDISQNSSDIATNAAALANCTVRKVAANESVSGVSQITFTGLQAGKRYRLEFELNWDSPPTSDYIKLRFGGASGIDTGSNYFWRNDYYYGTPSYTNELNGGDHAMIDYSFDYNNNTHIGTIEFSIHSSGSTKASGLFRSSQSSYKSYRQGMLSYAGSETVDRVQLFTNGSLVSGAARLFKSN